MADRYTIISKHDSMLYLSGCPIVVLAGALLKDNYTDSMMVQLKLENIGLKPVAYLTVSLSVFDDSGVRYGEDVLYTYSDMNIARDSVFGAKTAIVLPDNTVSSYKLRIAEIGFTDETSSTFTDGYLLPLKAPERLEDVLGSKELANQFKISYGPDCVYYPADRDKLWFCTCGAINLSDETKCHKCKKVYSALKSINTQALKSEASRRAVSDRKYDIEEDVQRSEKRKNTKKLIFILLPVALVLALILATVPGYFIRKSNYAKAQTLLSEGKFKEATAAFEKLGSYLDSSMYLEQEIPYQKAAYIYNCAQHEDTDGLVMLGIKRSEFNEDETVSTVLYERAAEMFKVLGEYKDSAALADSAEKAIEEYREKLLAEEYAAAYALLEGESYCLARDAFEKLGEYMDSAEMALECINRKISALAALYEKYTMDGVYCKISLDTGVKSTFYIPTDVFIKLGSSVSADIRAACGEDGAEIFYEEASGDELLPFTQALNAFGTSNLPEDALLPSPTSVGQETVDDVQVFYDLCAVGDLNSALQWLSGYGGNQLNRDVWINAINFYLPFCASWVFEEGDPSLIPATLGVQAQCTNFISTVALDPNGGAQLLLYPAGSTDYTIRLHSEIAEDGTLSFNVSPDGMDFYYVVINNAGRFNYSKYNIYTPKQSTNSSTYKKA